MKARSVILAKSSWVLHLATAVLAILIISATIPAPQVGAQESSNGQSASFGCAKKLRASAPDTHACARIIAPRVVNLGEPFQVTIKFRARMSVRNVRLQVFNLSASTPKYALNKRYTFVRKGRVIERSVTMTYPASAAPAEPTGFTTRAGAIVQWGKEEYNFIVTAIKVLGPT